MSSPRKRTAEDPIDNEEPLGSSPAPEVNENFPSSPGGIASSPFAQDDDIIAEENEVEDDLDEMAEEEAGEDLFDENMERDYRRAGERDDYDIGDVNIDDADYQGLDINERRLVDEQLNRRDRMMARGPAFLDDDAEDFQVPTQRRRRNQFDEDLDLMSDTDPMTEELSLSSLADVKAESIAAWITQPSVHKAIAREFKNFLLEYTDDKGRSVYGSRIRTLGEINSESLEISYGHLAESKAILAYFLANAPEEMLRIFDVVAMEATALHYPDYASIHPEIHVRVSDLPTIYSLRELREAHMNCLVRVTGVVTRRTGVFPQLRYVKFTCNKCGASLGPFVQENTNKEVKVGFCYVCQSRGPHILDTQHTIYSNYQKMTLQESPGTVPPGRLPRHREIILLADLIDVARPGEEVDVTGIYKNSFDSGLNAKHGFPVFATVIEANLVKRREGRGDGLMLTEEEVKRIRSLSKEPGIINKIIKSIAPSIYGHDDIKNAIACSLFAGVHKDVQGKHSIRGDINVLLMGDPGTSKSQFLKYVEKIAHRAVFATGQGASAVGLTASVRRDPVTSEWTLEGGALVLADKGTCLIDEFDKMNDQDRTSIHEAMEQQSISISKAGIVTTLQARCGIIAAANPRGGRYNSTIPFAQNVDLTEPILSRFDILCVVRDIVDPETDERLAKFVVDSHYRSHPVDDEDLLASLDNEEQQRVGSPPSRNEENTSPIDQDLLAKYIHYARENIRPKLDSLDRDKLSRVYADMRDKSIKTGSFPITVRHLESIIRIAESFAKMRMSEYVSEGDLNRAIKVAIGSFVGAQKISVKRSLQKSFMKYTLPRSSDSSARFNSNSSRNEQVAAVAS